VTEASNEQRVVVGFANFRLTLQGECWNTMEGESCLFVYDLQLAAHVRRKGAGKQLLLTLEMMARQTKLSHICALLMPSSSAATAFFLSVKGWRDDTASVRAMDAADAADHTFRVYAKCLDGARLQSTEATSQVQLLAAKLSVMGASATQQSQVKMSSGGALSSEADAGAVRRSDQVQGRPAPAEPVLIESCAKALTPSKEMCKDDDEEWVAGEDGCFLMASAEVAVVAPAAAAKQKKSKKSKKGGAGSREGAQHTAEGVPTVAAPSTPTAAREDAGEDTGGAGALRMKSPFEKAEEVLADVLSAAVTAHRARQIAKTGDGTAEELKGLPTQLFGSRTDGPFRHASAVYSLEQTAVAGTAAVATAVAAEEEEEEEEEEEAGGVDAVLEELCEMFEERHGRAATKVEVDSWVATIKEANMAQKA